MKGFMVGNGVTNWTYDTLPAMVEVAYWRSLLNQETYDKMKNEKCKYDGVEFDKNPSESCMSYVNFLTDDLMSKIDVYNIYGPCWPANVNVTTNNHHNTLAAYQSDSNKALKVVDGKLVTYKRFSSAYEYTPWLFRGKDIPNELPPCVFGGPLIDWANDANVRK